MKLAHLVSTYLTHSLKPKLYDAHSDSQCQATLLDKAKLEVHYVHALDNLVKYDIKLANKSK